MKTKIKIITGVLLAFLCIIAVTRVSAQVRSSDASSSAAKPLLLNQETPQQMTDIWDVLHNRRSVRKYKPTPVPDADILKIIDAARMAPTSGNQQPWKFLVVKDKNLINHMMDGCVNGYLSRYDANPGTTESREQFEIRIRRTLAEGYFSAPVFIVVLTDNNSKYPDYNHWDGPLAAGYLMLAARALGYGTVFITDAIPDDVTKSALSIPDNYTRVCITPLGVPFEWPATPPKKDLNDMISFDRL